MEANRQQFRFCGEGSKLHGRLPSAISPDCLMRTTSAVLLALLLLAAPGAAQAQFTYTTNNGAITLAEYTGSGGAVAISNFVASIGDYAFSGCTGLTGVTIPDGVTSIGEGVFNDCTSLGSVLFPGSLTNIGYFAFQGCNGLTTVTLPGSVSSIGYGAFQLCPSLSSAYFQGNAPDTNSPVFIGFEYATVYYLPGATGWAEFAANTGLSPILWNPMILTGNAGFGLTNNQFRFNVTGTTNIPIVVEACANLANPVWISLTNVTLTNGLFHFSEPLQAGSPARYYRIGSP